MLALLVCGSQVLRHSGVLQTEPDVADKAPVDLVVVEEHHDQIEARADSKERVEAVPRREEHDNRRCPDGNGRGEVRADAPRIRNDEARCDRHQKGEHRKTEVALLLVGHQQEGRRAPRRAVHEAGHGTNSEPPPRLGRLGAGSVKPDRGSQARHDRARHQAGPDPEPPRWYRGRLDEHEKQGNRRHQHEGPDRLSPHVGRAFREDEAIGHGRDRLGCCPRGGGSLGIDKHGRASEVEFRGAGRATISRVPSRGL